MGKQWLISITGSAHQFVPNPFRQVLTERPHLFSLHAHFRQVLELHLVTEEDKTLAVVRKLKRRISSTPDYEKNVFFGHVTFHPGGLMREAHVYCSPITWKPSEHLRAR